MEWKYKFPFFNVQEYQGRGERFCYCFISKSTCRSFEKETKHMVSAPNSSGIILVWIICHWMAVATFWFCWYFSSSTAFFWFLFHFNKFDGYNEHTECMADIEVLNGWLFYGKEIDTCLYKHTHTRAEHIIRINVGHFMYVQKDVYIHWTKCTKKNGNS